MAMEKKSRDDERRRTLKQYLTRYYRAKQRQTILRNRLRRLRRELQSYGTGDLAEIEAQIKRSAEEANRAVLEIMEVLALLPQDSIERTILELRHIDCKPWREIQREVFLTRTPCYDHYNKGLDKLLEAKEVHERLAHYKAFFQ